MGATVQSISVADVSAREVDVRGVMRYCNVSSERSRNIHDLKANITLFAYTDIPYCYPNVGFWKN